MDGRTGKNFDPCAGDISERVRQVQEHRRANSHIYTDQHELDSGYIRQQIIDYVCTRNPSLCVGEIKTMLENPEKPKSPACPKCGATDATPKYCASCGGSKIESYTCSSCGTKF
jgi:hypothetical protein